MNIDIITTSSVWQKIGSRKDDRSRNRGWRILRRLCRALSDFGCIWRCVIRIFVIFDSCLGEIKKVMTSIQQRNIVFNPIQLLLWDKHLHEAIDRSLPLQKGKITVGPIDTAWQSIQQDVVKFVSFNGNIIGEKLGSSNIVPIVVPDWVVDCCEAIHDRCLDGGLNVHLSLDAGSALGYDKEGEEKKERKWMAERRIWHWT